MVVLIATLSVQPGKMEQALAACSAVKAPSLLEDGCLRYDFHTTPEVEDQIVFVEEWESREILNAHFEMSYFKVFASQTGDFLSQPPHIRIYEIASYEDL